MAAASIVSRRWGASEEPRKKGRVGLESGRGSSNWMRGLVSAESWSDGHCGASQVKKMPAPDVQLEEFLNRKNADLRRAGTPR